jgi:hypothetical protein
MVEESEAKTRTRRHLRPAGEDLGEQMRHILGQPIQKLRKPSEQ